MLRAVSRIVVAVISRLLGIVRNAQPLTNDYVPEVPVTAVGLLSLAFRKRQEAFINRKFDLRIQLLNTIMIKSLYRQFIKPHRSTRRKRSAYELSGDIELLDLDDVVTSERMFKARSHNDDYEPPSKRARYTGQNHFASYAYYHGVKRSLNSGTFNHV
uniref:Secreted protein n=1 Tax=Ascaris lumbricoides TaxID=6252 RepID=A0A0M3HUP3_ASCLU